VNQVYKAVTADLVESDKGDTPRSATFCISSGRVDRSFDRVNVHGIDTRNWEKSGAIWMAIHSSGSKWPIGTSINPVTKKLDFWVSGDKAYAKVHFDLTDPEAVTAAKKIARGLCKHASIAFLGLPHAEAKQNVYGGMDYHRIELTEVSAVPIPDNTDAELVAVHKGWAPPAITSPPIVNAASPVASGHAALAMTGLLQAQRRNAEAKHLCRALAQHSGTATAFLAEQKSLWRAADGGQKATLAVVLDKHADIFNRAKSVAYDIEGGPKTTHQWDASTGDGDVAFADINDPYAAAKYMRAHSTAARKWIDQRKGDWMDDPKLAKLMTTADVLHKYIERSLSDLLDQGDDNDDAIVEKAEASPGEEGEVEAGRVPDFNSPYGADPTADLDEPEDYDSDMDDDPSTSEIQARYRTNY
jgi:hypothetical protein